MVDTGMPTHAFSGSFDMILPPQPAVPKTKDLFYHGCQKCTDFSGAFGGSLYSLDKDDEGFPSTTIYVDSEENFERVKSLFVTHFNKYHKDITRNKEKDTREYKKFGRELSIVNGSSQWTEVELVEEPKSPSTLAEQAMGQVFDRIILGGTAFSTSEPFGRSMFSTIGAEIPEYETTGEESTRRMRD